VGGTPVICGGAKERQPDTKTGYTCLQFSPVSAEGTWKTDYAKLSCPRTRHTSWVTSAGKMVQLGGGNCFTGETVPSTNKFNLPPRQAKRDACLINAKGSEVFITGGQSSEDVVEKYNKNDFSKEALPKLKTGRYSHGCGSYLDSDGNTVLVVAGGKDKIYEPLKSTEIFKLGDSEWSAGPDLPFELESMASINWAKDNSVFFIGGTDGTVGPNGQDKSDKIFSFDGETWKEIQKLPVGRSSAAVAQVVAEDYQEFCK